MQYLSQHWRGATAGRSLKEQQLFLQVRGEVEKGEDLTHARPADDSNRYFFRLANASISPRSRYPALLTPSRLRE